MESYLRSSKSPLKNTINTNIAENNKLGSDSGGHFLYHYHM